MKHNNKLYLGLLAGTLASGLLVNQAEAVPSFSRQTNMACAACHTVFPELNAFGRSFKLNGYTLTGIAQVKAKDDAAASGLQIDQIPPLSAMLQVSAVHTKNGTTPSTTVGLPDQLSLFVAGEITPHMGSFIQLTMEQGTGFGMDNTDIRYANHSGNVTYGVTLNNNPTAQDLWNSTPAWGFPFTHGVDASPLIANGGDVLGGNVAGLGGYADWGNGFFTEVSLYKDTGAFVGPSGTSVGISGAAPYYRLAWSKTFTGGSYLMVGAYGMQTTLVDSTSYAGLEDKYSDTAIDMQYEHPLANSNMLSVHARYTNEKQTLDLTGGGVSPTLKSTRVDAIYHWGYHATATLGYANDSGISGAENTAVTAQYSYLPWQNTKFTAQYVSYTKVAGSTANASDNNTMMLQGWLMW